MGKYFFKSYFVYSKQQRKGIFTLGLLVILLVIGISVNYYLQTKSQPKLYFSQSLVEKVKAHQLTHVKKYKIYPFNPNYLSDYKASKLGLSVAEIDRLFAFRKEGNYINTKTQFQEVTNISDSLFFALEPYIKVNTQYAFQKKKLIAKIIQKDINTATEEDLIIIRGIGPKKASTIIKYRNRLQGYSSLEQLNEVYGMDAVLVAEISKYFNVQSLPTIQKININNATFKELLSIVYLNYDLVKSILNYKKKYGDFKTLDQLKEIKDFPVDKFDLISLYLQAQ